MNVLVCIKSIGRYLLLIACVLGFMAINYYKSDYLIDFVNMEVIPNTGVNEQDFQTESSGLINQVSQSPKWMFHLILSFAFFIFTTILVYLFFLSKKLAYITMGLYLLIFGITFLFLLSGIFLNSFDLAYKVNRFIKDQLIQSPFVLLLISAIGIGMKKSTSVKS